MCITKKFRTDAERLHAALVETDPSSIDLIHIGAPGFLPLLRIPAMVARAPYPVRQDHAPPASARGRAGPVPNWRHRCFASSKTTVPA